MKKLAEQILKIIKNPPENKDKTWKEWLVVSGQENLATLLAERLCVDEEKIASLLVSMLEAHEQDGNITLLNGMLDWKKLVKWYAKNIAQSKEIIKLKEAR